MKVKMRCQYCNKTFDAYPSQSKTGEVKYCSRKCYYDSYKATLSVRFWGGVDIGNPNDCWNWKLSTKGKYGRIYVEGKGLLAHRVVWILTHGDIPAGMCVCHKCDNPKCVNPTHLFLGTLKDNAQDMIKKGRRYDTGGENNGHAKLTWRKVHAIRKRYIPYKVTQQKLANEYGVSTSIISEVINGNTWKE